MTEGALVRRAPVQIWSGSNPPYPEAVIAIVRHSQRRNLQLFPTRSLTLTLSLTLRLFGLVPLRCPFGLVNCLQNIVGLKDLAPEINVPESLCMR